ncbi:MAG: protein kinase [Bacteroidia bacterium]|nr:protein kinase [Bacteroidia bacterium]
MSDLNTTIPVIVLAYANERSEKGFLRQLTTELKTVMQALEPSVQKGRVHLKVIPAATQEEIVEVFQDEWYSNRIQIFHYGGHAAKDQLWLETEDGGNESFFSLGLAKFLGAQKGLRLVFLNGCATEDHARLMLAEDIPAIIATSEKINDLMARRFAEVFYSGMAGGASIEESFAEAEGILLGSYGPSSFVIETGKRSLYWEEEESEQGLDLPWKLALKEGSSWFPAQWRLFYKLDEDANEDEESIDAKEFVGETINNYRILELLGSGSLGSVYKALHIGLNEERAIKITHRVIEGYDYLKDIVLAGNKGLASIKHANVVKFYDVGEVQLFGQKRMYMVMELVNGDRLDKVGIESLCTEPASLVDLVVQIASGLEAAHKTSFTDAAGMPREGIIHGNLKTRKILLSEGKSPKLIDFLFADISRNYQIKLDIPEDVQKKKKAERLSRYFPEEVLSGKSPVSKKTDIYSLGAVLFEVFSRGKAIADFDFKSVNSLHRFVKSETQIIPLNVSKAIFKATRKDPDERYDAMNEMIQDLLLNVSWFKKILYWLRRK